MKVKVIRVFYDNNGLHRVGDVIETTALNPELMVQVEERKEAVTKKAAIKKNSED